MAIEILVGGEYDWRLEIENIDDVYQAVDLLHSLCMDALEPGSPAFAVLEVAMESLIMAGAEA